MSPKVLPEGSLLLREERMEGTISIDGEECPVKYYTDFASGLPIVEFDGRFVVWNTKELIETAVEMVREEREAGK